MNKLSSLKSDWKNFLCYYENLIKKHGLDTQKKKKTLIFMKKHLSLILIRDLILNKSKLISDAKQNLVLKYISICMFLNHYILCIMSINMQPLISSLDLNTSLIYRKQIHKEFDDKQAVINIEQQLFSMMLNEKAKKILEEE
ncbi:C2H2 finger domain-containing protein [Histoplasma capsulatum var. duboisii H88]|uniref:C2H2 finger domain-containing protein n=1 Tax=Ajellomyces capsulatus (strain H88) TaxID=544711 RepID=F0UM60_AJEC8|nr:C2H2 finger domain-containing protein [Histoplasma capsulatum var. duboisii H88]